MKSAKASKASEIPANAPRVTVKKLTIKDTDAGLLNTSVFEQKGYLSQIHHMHPKTYDCLQTLAQKWTSDPTVKQFFHRECTFSSSQHARFEKYLCNAATTLRGRKENGTLHLDLDLDDYFQGTTPQPVPQPTPQPVVSKISASVGRWEKGAANQPADVKTVQRLLTSAAQKQHAPQLDPKGVDGLISRPPRKSNTVAAIEAFESLSQLAVDGLIDPAGAAWQALRKAAGEV